MWLIVSIALLLFVINITGSLWLSYLYNDNPTGDDDITDDIRDEKDEDKDDDDETFK